MIIAGLQIALTNPMKIDDVVIVEGECGEIGGINLTYVVLQPVRRSLSRPGKDCLCAWR